MLHCLLIRKRTQISLCPSGPAGLLANHALFLNTQEEPHGHLPAQPERLRLLNRLKSMFGNRFFDIDFRLDFLRQPAGRPDRYQQPQDFIKKQCNFSQGRLPAVPIRILLALVHMHKQCNISNGPSAVRYQTIPYGRGGGR